jgi:RHS repeat-associated protein
MGDYVGGLGHESDTNKGLIYMRARYMEPVLGRFLSEDPSKDGGNWFVYCGGEPVNHIDENGHELHDIGISDILHLIAYCSIFLTTLICTPLARLIGAAFLVLFIGLIGGALIGITAAAISQSLMEGVLSGTVGAGVSAEMAALVLQDTFSQAGSIIDNPPKVAGKFTNATPYGQLIGTITCYTMGYNIAEWILSHD